MWPVSARPDTTQIVKKLGKSLEVLEVSSDAIHGWKKRWIKIRGQWKLFDPETLELTSAEFEISDVIPVPVRRYSQNYWVRCGRLWGIYSVETGKFAYQPSFSKIDAGETFPDQRQLFPFVWVCKKGLWGCFNTSTLKFHIEPTARENPRTTGLAVVDQKGKAIAILPFEYDEVSDGITVWRSDRNKGIEQYVVSKKGRCGLVGFKDDKPVTFLECAWKKIDPLYGSNDWDSWVWAFAIQDINGKWGLFDSTAKIPKMLVPCQYDSVGMFKAANYVTYIVFTQEGRTRFYLAKEQKFLS